MTQLIDPKKFTHTVGLLRSFFLDKGFDEVHTQNRLSILAACEDPFNVATYNYAGQVWPLPQTGQMWLEHELLTKPDSKGFFCVSTSYRQEPNAIPGRHDIIFPMFEFEMPGTIDDLKAMEYELLTRPEEKGFFCVSTSYRQEPNAVEGRHDIIFPMFEFEMPGNVDDLKAMEIELCEYLGFPKLEDKTYYNWASEFEVEELDHEHEEKINHGMITHFPEFTSPFWNMSRNDDGVTSKKIDVILGGMETIGSAERSTDVEQMRDTFHTITDGEYAKLLFELFSKERVEAELEEFLKHDFFPRVGGGIGMTRMISALDKI